MSDFTSTLLSYHYYLEDGLFKELELPDGIDKDVLVNSIMLECGEMQPVWTNPDFMQRMIGTWGQKWYHTFEKWITALSIEYNPLENYDRIEEWTDTNGGTVSADSTTGSSRSAYDSATLTPYDSVKYDNTDTIDTEAVHDGRIHGNIGVTTSQQMLEAELKVAEWNIYEHIKDLFMQDFCIMIY